jgi:hypothetical protein
MRDNVTDPGKTVHLLDQEKEEFPQKIEDRGHFYK